MKVNQSVENYGCDTVIEKLNLAKYISEVEDIGFTVIPPEIVASENTRKEILAKIIEIAEKKTGNTLKLDQNTNSGNYKAIPQTDSQFVLYQLLFEDEIFERWLMNEIILCLSSYFLNNQAQLSTMSSFIKWKGVNYKDSLGLHADTQPSPNGKLPSEWVDACNSVLCLTDYTKDDGALAVVPYSHKIARQPSADDYKKSNVIPVEAPAGSLIFWHGNLWHGAFPKLTDGLRINLTTFMNHRRIKTQECIKEKVTQEMLDRNPGKHFARMVGLNDSNGFDQNGPVLDGIINYGTEDQMKRFTFNVKDYKKRNR
tara:strand:+ start:140 stop:1078 length:939 start_codon:yes stop_codon:yes gene_type:complete